MKILAINSSLRKHGNTERIFQLMEQSLLKIATERLFPNFLFDVKAV